MTRRRFLEILAAGSVAVSLTPFIQIQEFLIPKIESFENTRKKIANIADLEPNSFMVFGFPGDSEKNPRYSSMLIRLKNGDFKAFNRVCTHLRCLVNYEPDDEEIFCPCHAGTYSSDEGNVVSGPPPRSLPLIELEIDDNDDIWAVGMTGEIGRGR